MAGSVGEISTCTDAGSAPFARKNEAPPRNMTVKNTRRSMVADSKVSFLIVEESSAEEPFPKSCPSAIRQFPFAAERNASGGFVRFPDHGIAGDLHDQDIVLFGADEFALGFRAVRVGIDYIADHQLAILIDFPHPAHGEAFAPRVLQDQNSIRVKVVAKLDSPGLRRAPCTDNVTWGDLGGHWALGGGGLLACI